MGPGNRQHNWFVQQAGWRTAAYYLYYYYTALLLLLLLLLLLPSTTPPATTTITTTTTTTTSTATTTATTTTTTAATTTDTATATLVQRCCRSLPRLSQESQTGSLHRSCDVRLGACPAVKMLEKSLLEDNLRTLRSLTGFKE